MGYFSDRNERIKSLLYMENTSKETVTSKRELALQRLKSKYPEDNFDDDEAVFGRINGDYDDYDRQIKERDDRIAGYEADEKALGEMFSSDPRSAMFMSKWSKGGDPSIALIQEFGNDIIDIINDPKRQQEVAEANKAFAARVAKNKEYEEEYKKNLDRSMQTIEDMKAKGVSDDEIDAIMSATIAIVSDGLRGIFSPETLDMVRKAISHDKDVSVASEEGEIRGRNAKIEERLRRPAKGDGTPALGGGNGGNAPAGKPMGALERFGEGNTSIWDKGGEKRIQHR